MVVRDGRSSVRIPVRLNLLVRRGRIGYVVGQDPTSPYPRNAGATSVIKIIRATVALAFCAVGVLAALHLGQARRDVHRAAAGRAAHEAWLEGQPPSPWEMAREAQVRWVAEAERHRPACRALAEFL